jgi:hypothetical protein
MGEGFASSKGKKDGTAARSLPTIAPILLRSVHPVKEKKIDDAH